VATALVEEGTVVDRPEPFQITRVRVENLVHVLGAAGVVHVDANQFDLAEREAEFAATVRVGDPGYLARGRLGVVHIRVSRGVAGLQSVSDRDSVERPQPPAAAVGRGVATGHCWGLSSTQTRTHRGETAAALRPDTNCNGESLPMGRLSRQYIAVEDA